MSRPLKRIAPVALSAMLLLPLSADAQDAEEKTLSIGDAAPSLDIEHYLSTGSGFGKVTDFKPGKVTIVEFWATWCGPCIASMPHLAEMQKKYADQGVQIVSISDEPLEKVQGFLDRKLPGVEEDAGDEESDEEGADENAAAEKSDEPKTYGELTSVYTLTTDPDESTYQDYMEAASQNGIPASFVVGPKGEVEWIGHPMLLEQNGIIEGVLDGTYDREAFKKQFEEEQKFNRLQSVVFRALSGGDTQKALKTINDFKTENPDAAANPMFTQIQLTTYMRAGDAEGFTDVVLGKLKEAEEPTETIGTARMLAAGAQQMTIPADALKKATDSLTAIEGDVEGGIAAFLYDTVARLQVAAGNLDKAEAAQKKAIGAAEGNPGLLKQVEAGMKEIEEAREAATAEESDE